MANMCGQCVLWSINGIPWPTKVMRSPRQPHPVSQHINRYTLDFIGRAVGHHQPAQGALLLRNQVYRLKFVHVPHGDIHIHAQGCAEGFDFLGQFFQHDGDLAVGGLFVGV